MMLPIRPKINTDESLIGYVIRLAKRNYFYSLEHCLKTLNLGHHPIAFRPSALEK